MKLVFNRLILALSFLLMFFDTSRQEELKSTNTARSYSEHVNCPSWGKCHNNKCVCNNAFNSYYSVKCDNETLQLSVLKCHCVTFDNETKQMYEGACIENCENAHSDFLPLPKETNKLNQLMCEERWNRTGRLCGKCLPGHSPLAYSYDMRCVKCPESGKNIWKYILVGFGPLTIFYFLVLFLKINATSSYLHGYLIFSQIISTPSFARNVVEYTLVHPKFKAIQLIVTLYSIWNLDFFRGLYPDICLNASTLTVLALDYAVAIYPLLLSVISYFLIKLYGRNFRIVVILWKPFRYIFTLLRRNWDSRTTVIDAYATFYILSFTKVLMISVSADLLTPVRAHSLVNDSVTWVLYYDGTVDYFGREHLPYVVLAIACLVLFIVPTTFLLLFYHLKYFQKLTSGLKLHSQLLPALMDSFQGCYKNGIETGTRDYRWFAAVPLLGRIILLFVYSMTLDKSVFSFLIMVIVAIIAITAVVQPYKSRFTKYAKNDITFWVFLAAFYAANEGATYGNIKTIKIGATLQIITGVIPLLYMVCICAYWILSRMRKIKKLMHRLRARRNGYINIENNFEETLPDRIINPEQYQERDLQELSNDTNTCTNDTY